MNAATAAAALAAASAAAAANAAEESARATRRAEALILVKEVSEKLKTRITGDLSQIRELRQQIAALQSQRRKIAGFSLPEVKELAAITEQIEKLETLADRMEHEFRHAILTELKAAIESDPSEEKAGDLLLHIASFAHLPELPQEDLLHAAILSGDADSMDRILQDRSFQFPDELRDLACRLGDKEISRVMDKRAKEIKEWKEQAKKDFDREFPEDDSKTGD